MITWMLLVQELTELKRMPVCETVTKLRCDSKWEVTEEGTRSVLASHWRISGHVAAVLGSDWWI